MPLQPTKTPQHAFGIKHSPYLGALKGDAWAGTKVRVRLILISRDDPYSSASIFFTFLPYLAKVESAGSAVAVRQSTAAATGAMTNGHAATNGHSRYCKL